MDSFDPHGPWDPPTEYADRYAPRVPALEPIVPGFPHDCEPEILNRVKALYYGEITFADKWLGVLLRKLDALNLWDDTIVMVVSDHGTELWDINRCSKSAQRLFPFNTQQIWMIRHPEFNNCAKEN